MVATIDAQSRELEQFKGRALGQLDIISSYVQGTQPILKELHQHLYQRELRGDVVSSYATKQELMDLEQILKRGSLFTNGEVVKKARLYIESKKS